MSPKTLGFLCFGEVLKPLFWVRSWAEEPLNDVHVVDVLEASSEVSTLIWANTEARLCVRVCVYECEGVCVCMRVCLSV